MSRMPVTASNKPRVTIGENASGTPLGWICSAEAALSRKRAKSAIATPNAAEKNPRVKVVLCQPSFH